MKMIMSIDTFGVEHIRKALRDEVSLICPEDVGYPKPKIWEKEKDIIVYETASGCGSYEFDFRHDGSVTIIFEGRRNSLLSGTPFFHLDIPSGIEAKKLEGSSITLTTRCRSGSCGVYIDTKVLMVKTSALKQVLREIEN